MFIHSSQYSLAVIVENRQFFSESILKCIFVAFSRCNLVNFAFILSFFVVEAFAGIWPIFPCSQFVINAGHFICSFPVRCCQSCFLRCSRAMRETPSSRQSGWTDSKRWCPSNSVNLKCHGPWYFCCAGAMFWKASITLFCTLCQCVENKCKKSTFI